jgi:hypothetical protein
VLFFVGVNMDRVCDVLVFVFGFFVYPLVCRWVFGGNPFRLPRFALLFPFLFAGSFCLGDIGPTATATIGWDAGSALGQGGGAWVSEFSDYAGTFNTYPLTWWVGLSESYAVGNPGNQGGQNGVSWSRSATVDLLLFTTGTAGQAGYSQYWQGDFWISQVSAAGATGQSQRVVVQVVDTPDDRHVVLLIGGSSYTIHGANGDTGASTLFNLQFPADDFADNIAVRGGNQLVFGVPIVANPYGTVGLYQPALSPRLSVALSMPTTPDGYWFIADLSGQTFASSGGGGVVVNLPSSLSGTAATTQATSQPSVPDSGDLVDGGYNFATTGANAVNGYQDGVGPKSTAGPQVGDMPWKSHIIAFVQPSDVCTGSDWGKASTAFCAVMNTFDTNLSAANYGTGGFYDKGMWNGDGVPGVGGGTGGTWTGVGIDGFQDLIGRFFQGYGDFQYTYSGFFSLFNLVNGGLFSWMILRRSFVLVCWGLGYRGAERGDPGRELAAAAAAPAVDDPYGGQYVPASSGGGGGRRRFQSFDR